VETHLSQVGASLIRFRGRGNGTENPVGCHPWRENEKGVKIIPAQDYAGVDNFGLRGRADNVCAFPSGELNRAGANTTSSSVDQDALTRLQRSIFKERGPGNRRSARDRGCFVKTERLWLLG
jgi:hypothetical protein